ncbi:hypothetical protein Ancab_012285 [Ancistrocladus abbreviatus]
MGRDSRDHEEQKKLEGQQHGLLEARREDEDMIMAGGAVLFLNHDHDGYDHQDDANVVADPSRSLSSSSSGISNGSSSELFDDAISSCSLSSSSLKSNGGGSSFCDLSVLMNHLPIKRGLSKFYHGKSQSFTSLARVGSIEDLAKDNNKYLKRLKACKSYGGGLKNHKSKSSYTQPKPTITKRPNSNSKTSLSMSCLNRKDSSVAGGCRPPLSPVVQSSF